MFLKQHVMVTFHATYVFDIYIYHYKKLVLLTLTYLTPSGTHCILQTPYYMPALPNPPVSITLQGYP